ncbi:ParB/RepB/Spo0J family partition protein [Streptomyces sp. MC1]|uniref:ParB/RepB/Spo0J family partition protein n=1 Tax=Streptomyces sp. MC1 TaxID=295105 RepID=UPI0018CAB8A7|nr:ParB/RepB/Spo0J family partition protein [Streptomyces sp. MC1]MBG7704915.1 ParB/RepB/Spo0J family partition protein [Streptomyces sp. MC1]
MAGSLKKAARKPSRPGVPAPAAPADSTPKFFDLGVEEEGDALKVKVSDITANPFNDRDLGDITQLAQSIDQDGLLQDIVVMHTEAFARYYPAQAEHITTKYVIAFGERRWRAHMHLGLETVSAILRNGVAEKIRRVLFAENFHRKQLSAIEEARKFRVLHVEEGMSYREIVTELKLSGPNYVARRMELLELPPALQDIVGTEEGPGVTLARKIRAQLTEPEEQIQAWELIRDEDLSLAEAVDRIRHADPVPPGNTVTESSAGAPVPPGNTSVAVGQEQPVPPETTPANGEGVPQGNTSGSGGDTLNPPAAPQPPVQRKAAAADRDAVERNHASADRDASCRHLVSDGPPLTAEQHDALYARTLLAPMQQGPARTRAHRWLRDAGRAVFDISDTDSYFEAVLSSGQADLVNRVATATALAAGEVRARDGRRQWDRTDAEHVRLLIETTGYVPATAWERAQLDKFGVPYNAADAPDPEPIH